MSGWTDDLATGITEIDNQHKELFKRSGKVLDAIGTAAEIETILETVNFLEEYVLVHFALEEKFMVDFKYPDYEGHKTEHEAFKEKLVKMTEELKVEGPSSYYAFKVDEWLYDWLIKHVTNIDKALARFLSKREAT